MKRVGILNFVAGSWETGDSTWDSILTSNFRSKGQLIFASLRTIANAPDVLKAHIIEKFELEPVLLTNICLDSNGFAGCKPVCNDQGNLTSYNFWSRFIAKQTHERLRPKSSFIRRTPMPPQLAKANVPIHTSRSIRNGWEWYEMGFFVQWTPSSTVILCFDLPEHFQIAVRKAFTLSANKADFSDPYRMFATIINELLPVYDNSVWSIRNHICNWEAARTEEPDYSLLHEIARHTVHISETISVASKSLKELQEQHREFVIYGQSRPYTQGHWCCDHFKFPLMILDGLLSRSKSNECRVQNETQLAFHTAAQRDSRIQLRIAEEAKKEATTMKAIAVITMTFLPATFVSSIFSTPFFHSEPDKAETKNSFVVSNQFWIYWALTLPLSLSILTIWIFWDRVWIKRQGKPNHSVDV